MKRAQQHDWHKKRLDKHSYYCIANLFLCFAFRGEIKNCRQRQSAFENCIEKRKSRNKWQKIFTRVDEQENLFIFKLGGNALASFLLNDTSEE